MSRRALSYGFLFGVLAGIGDVAVPYARALLFGTFPPRPDTWWLAPLTGGVLFAIITASADAVAAASRVRFRDRIAVAVPVTLLVANGLLSFSLSRLHPVSVWLLALGCGVQAGRWARHASGRDRWFASLAAVACVTLVGVDALAELRRGAELHASPPRAASGPNVLLVVLDTVRPYELSAYGFDRPTTPFLASLASQGIRFTQAFSVSPWTGPGHAGLFTGRWADELSIDWQTPLDDEHPTLAQALHSMGYRTGGVTANTEYTSRRTGLQRGFQFYSDRPPGPGRLARALAMNRWLWWTPPAERWLEHHDQPWRIRAELVSSRFLEWLDSAETDAPFFAFLNYYDAHDPYYPPEDMWAEFVDPPTPRVSLALETRTDWSPEEVELRRQAYMGSIAHLDRTLEALFAELERRNALDDTIVIVTADHGEEFNEHGVMGHANSLYVQGLAVPLLIAWPGRLGPGDVHVPVSTRQVPATVMSLIGETSSFPGPSLPMPTDPGADSRVSTSTMRFEVRTAIGLPDTYPVSHGPLSAIRRAGLWYLTRRDGREELYDAVKDPLQTRDLARRPESRLALIQMRRLFRAAFPDRAQATGLRAVRD